MPIHNTRADVGQASLSIVVTRANGDVEDLGVVSYYNKNPVINKIVNTWIKFKELRRKGK